MFLIEGWFIHTRTNQSSELLDKDILTVNQSYLEIQRDSRVFRLGYCYKLTYFFNIIKIKFDI